MIASRTGICGLGLHPLQELTRDCAAKAAAATDALTRARFEQEAEEWLARAREAEEAQRRPSRLRTDRSRNGRRLA
jgi:hypothetical protein